MSKVVFSFCALIALISSPLSGQVTPVTNAVFDLDTGELSVTGTADADSIVITVTASNIVEIGGVGTGINSDDVRTIFVEGLAGDDLIDLSGVVATEFTDMSSAEGAITIEGGPGDDTIFGSGLDDTIRGGAGDDFILGDQLAVNQSGSVLGFQEVATDLLGGVNFDRTKDADIADINNDGLLDIYDANSQVGSSSMALVIRFNDGMGGFNIVTFDNDDGVDRSTTYDSDLADLDDDGFPDLIRCHGRSVSVYLNQKEVGGWFNFAAPNLTVNFSQLPGGGTPDDIAVGDLDNDGDLDFAVARRFTPLVEVFINDGFRPQGEFVEFLTRQLTLDGVSGSMHDVFFVDANPGPNPVDNFLDIVAVNERGASRLFLNNGNRANLSFSRDEQLFPTGRGGHAADFNGDGVDDLIFGFNEVNLVLNDFSNPGMFNAPVELDGANARSFYDLEVGDLDNDGDLDVIGAAIASRTARIWLNDSNGNLNLFGNTEPLPGLDSEQWLSADLLDYDLDGDLDLYITGGDGDAQVRNQFFANALVQYGNDLLEGGAGNDMIYGGSGNDAIFGGGRIRGDVDGNGAVDFLDISPFITVIQTGGDQFEADIDGNGAVNLLDIAPFTELLSLGLVDGDDILVGGAGADLIAGGTGNDTFFTFRAALGDVNLDGQVDFLDISPFIAVLQAGNYQFEADVDGNGVVNFSDISPFTELLSNGQPLLRDGAEDVIDDLENGEILFNDE